MLKKARFPVRAIRVTWRVRSSNAKRTVTKNATAKDAAQAGHEIDQYAATFWRHASSICHPGISEGCMVSKSYPQSHRKAWGGLTRPHVGQSIPSRIPIGPLLW